MRKYTLLFSIVAHVCAASAVIFTTVLATGELPVPRDAMVFTTVAAPMPSPPPAARPRPEPIVNPSAAPTEAPEGVKPEPERPLLVDVGDPVIGVVGGFGNDTGLLPIEPPPPPPAAKPVVREPVRVGGVIDLPARIVNVPPVYPQMALAARVAGYVILEAVIGEDGSVRDVRVLKSIPLLDEAARTAVRQWKYKPTLLNGQPVPVVMTVTVSFKLD